MSDLPDFPRLMFDFESNLPKFPPRKPEERRQASSSDDDLSVFICDLDKIITDSVATLARAEFMKIWFEDQLAPGKPPLHSEDIKELKEWISAVRQSSRYAKETFIKETPGKDTISDPLIAPEELLSALMNYAKRIHAGYKDTVAEHEEDYRNMTVLLDDIHRNECGLHEMSQLLIKCGKRVENMKCVLFGSFMTPRMKQEMISTREKVTAEITQCKAAVSNRLNYLNYVRSAPPDYVENVEPVEEAPAGGEEESTDDEGESTADEGESVAGEEEPSAGEEEPAAGEEEPAAGEEEPAAGVEEPAVGVEKPAVPVEKPAAGVEEPATGEEKPATGEEKPAVGVEEPDAGKEEPAVAVEKPAAGEEKPAVGVEEPAVAAEEPAAGVEKPAAGVEEPAAGVEEPAVAAPGEPGGGPPEERTAAERRRVFFTIESFEESDDPRENEKRAEHMKVSIQVFLNLFLGAVEDVKTGAKRAEPGFFTPRIEEYMKYVSFRGGNYGQFNANKFIKEQKKSKTGKNLLLYNELETMLKNNQFKNPIRELLYFFRDKKQQEDPAPAYERVENIKTKFLEGYEGEFFLHLSDWIMTFWKDSLMKYVKVYTTVMQKNLKEAAKSNIILPIWSRKLPKFTTTEFFKKRVNFYLDNEATETTLEWMMKKFYDAFEMLPSGDVLNFDFNYLAGCPADEVDQVEIAIMEAVFSLDIVNLRLVF